MPEWKRVQINFPTVKLGQFIEPIKETVSDKNSQDFNTVYGVSNVEGITITGKKSSEDVSAYISIDEGCFVYNPYRVNVGSIGYNSNGIKGCVSPAYVVFKTKKGLNPDFLYSYLKSDFGNHLINWYGNHGGVRNALGYDDLCQLDIPEISSEVQSKLVRKINTFKPQIKNINVEIDRQSHYLSKLRQSILQEAIEGKLTAKWRQSYSGLISGENHASKLLEKIKAEKSNLVTEGKIRKEKLFSPVTDEEKPFELPEKWVWSRLGDIIYDLPKNGYSPKEVSYKTTVKSLKLGATTYGYFNPNEFKYVGDKIPENSLFWLEPGDILIQRGNSIDYVGVSAIYTGNYQEFIYPDLMMKIRIISPISIKLCHLFLSSPSIRNYFRINAKGSQWTMPKINQGVVTNTLIPLPPLPEQQVIVEQVDRLMSVINDLEKQVSERKDLSEKLMQAVLREAFEDTI